MRKNMAVVVCLVALGLGTRLIYLTYNLPVCANVDERTALGILLHLSPLDLNPHFFNYPTLYFYITWLISRPFVALADIIVVGRVLNICTALLLGLSTFVLARRLTSSLLTATVAGAFTLGSPIIIANGSYMSTDLLMTLLMVGSLLVATRERPLAGLSVYTATMIMLGLAIGTKYTAALLLGAVWLVDISAIPAAKERRLPRWLPGSALLLAGCLGIGIAVVWPQQLLMQVLTSKARSFSVLDASDMAFVASLRPRAGLLGGLLVGVAALTWLPPINRRITRLRPWIGLAIVAGVFVLTTPFSLIDARRFFYDVGIELKANAMRRGTANWLPMVHWYSDTESLIMVPFILLGVTPIWRRGRVGRIIIVYLGLSVLTIGFAHRGYSRYLTAVLPFLFCLAGAGLTWLTDALRYRHRQLALIVGAAVLVAASFEVFRNQRATAAVVMRVDEMHASYDMLTRADAQHVVCAGYGPTTELRRAGVTVTAVSRVAAANPGAAPFVAMRPGDFLILDGPANNQLSPELQRRLELELSVPEGYKQYVYLVTAEAVTTH